MEYLLYRSIDDSEKMEQLIQEIGFDNIIKSKNNGMISNILYHYIKLNKQQYIELILNNVELMKRDHLRLACYYYDTNFEISDKIFTENILMKYNLNTDYIISTKDIDYMIENKMFKLLAKLENIFIECSIQHIDEISNFDRFKLVDIPLESRQEILMKLNLKMKGYNERYNMIIDGGSVIHNRGGQVRKNSLKDLINISLKCDRPLIVIHKRHLKTFNNMIDEFKKHNIPYYLTPPNHNDDIYILWFFLNNVGSFILSNDKYRDHIFNLETKNKNTNSQFNIILAQQTLKFNCTNMWIQSKPTYSRCIQNIDNNLYIPHKSGNFIQIKL